MLGRRYDGYEEEADESRRVHALEADRTADDAAPDMVMVMLMILIS